MITDCCGGTTPLSGCCGSVDTPFTGTLTVVISSTWNSPNFYNQTVTLTYDAGRLVTVSEPTNVLIFTAENCPE